jgi:sulfhydrogenase subunit beta (sulfur reductase)
MLNLRIEKEEWDKALKRLLLSYSIFATVKNEFGLDYETIDNSNIGEITYNKPKPATPLKSFFLPVKENVTTEISSDRQRIILGVPSCDIAGLRLLDEIYLDKDFPDHFYRERRNNTIIISADCFDIQENCHCSSYGINPYSETTSDLAVILQDDIIIFRVVTDRGKEFLNQLSNIKELEDDSVTSAIERKHENTLSMLGDLNKDLPDYSRTGSLVQNAAPEIWKKYSSRCVSCGACAAICPTCSCFLLIDKPGFEKVKQLDTCQYPGFERVAGGEDALYRIDERFRNRYMCKFVWKPEKFNAIACTGCGRCIEACLGKINKNELFLELTT